ncbi:MAG: BamA/TamA family outer membrane protein [bacterium]|nr:BamA/TamA family outer membrane protein [bacterium]
MWARFKLCLRVGTVLVCLAGVSAPGQAARVLSVELRGDVAGRRMQGLIELLAVEPGGDLAFEDLRKSLRNLQASGLVGRAEASLVREAGGVRVVFSIFSRVQAAAVEIVGNDCLRDSQLRGALAQRPQTPLSESRVVRGVYRLQDLLSENGFRDRQVVLDVEIDEAEKLASVSYHVSCGEPTLVEKVSFVGSLGAFDSSELLGRLRMTAGRRFQRTKLTDERERLESWLGRQGYLSAEVGPPNEARDLEPRSVALEYPVKMGPKLDLRVLGFDDEVLRKRGLLQELEQERFDEALLLQTVGRIRSDFQGRGHYRARVTGEVVDLEERRQVNLLIQPGPTFSVKSLEFSGNELVPTSELVQRMASSTARTFSPGSGRLVDEVLEEDLSNLRSYYALQGLGGAEIGPARVTVSESAGALDVSIPIVEGPRRQVVEVTFEGITGFDPTARTFAIAAGGPFHPRRLEDTVAEIRALCEDLGYLSAQVSSGVTWDPTRSLASVVIQVLEGPRVTVDRVIFRGQAKTHTEVVRRSVGLESGDPVSRRQLLAGQRELYRLGIFSRVEVRLAPAMPFAPSRDILVRLEEGRPQRGSLGVGYDSEDGIRTLLGYSHGNLFGRAVATRFDLRLSQRERQARLLFRQPYLGGFRAPITYSIFGVEEQEESFDSERRGIQVDTEIAKGSTKFGALLTVKQVRVLDPDPALEAIEIDRNLQEVDIISLTPRFLIDRRNDPLVPTRGWTAGLQAEYAFSAFSASAEFLKLFGQQTAYIDLGRLGVVAGSLRVGALEPLGDLSALDPTVPGGLESANIPISERFFAGGRTTHRAYRRDLLGVPGESVLVVTSDDGGVRRVPIGGNGLLLANLDYRFPIAGAVGGTVFVDAGNVFGNWDTIDPEELEYGAGVGLRYLSPIGPLRLEVGWKLEKEPDQSGAVVFLSFGNPF